MDLYKAKGEQVAQTLQNYCNSEDSWKPVKEGVSFSYFCDLNM